MGTHRSLYICPSRDILRFDESCPPFRSDSAVAANRRGSSNDLPRSFSAKHRGGTRLLSYGGNLMRADGDAGFSRLLQSDSNLRSRQRSGS